MDIPQEIVSHAVTALVGGVTGFFGALVNRGPKMAEATDARLKILIQGYEKRTEGLVKQIENYERRIEMITQQYEQRIAALLQRMSEYERRLDDRMDALDDREHPEGETQ